MPRYGIEYFEETKDGKMKFSRETTATSEKENKEIIDRFNMKEKGATSHEVHGTIETDIVK